jgi:hypothetical protein
MSAYLSSSIRIVTSRWIRTYLAIHFLSLMSLSFAERRMNICHKVRFQVLTAITVKIIVVWDVTPCSLVDISRYHEGMYCLTLSIGELGHYSTVKMEAVCSSETSNCIFKTTWSHNLKGGDVLRLGIWIYILRNGKCKHCTFTKTELSVHC